MSEQLFHASGIAEIDWVRRRLTQNQRVFRTLEEIQNTGTSQSYRGMLDEHSALSKATQKLNEPDNFTQEDSNRLLILRRSIFDTFGKRYPEVIAAWNAAEDRRARESTEPRQT